MTMNETLFEMLLKPAAPNLGDVIFEAPGSKSHGTRVLVLSHLTGGLTELQLNSAADDLLYLKRALDKLRVARGCGGDLACGDGAAPARFLLAQAASTPGHWRLCGSAALSRRPMGPLIRALRDLGAKIRGEDVLPLEVIGSSTLGGDVIIHDAGSSQYLSALLLLLPRLSAGSRIIGCAVNSGAYVELTLHLMAEFGFSVLEEQMPGQTIWILSGARRPAPRHFVNPQDPGGAAYAASAAALRGESVILPLGAAINHPDMHFFTALQSLGVEVSPHERGLVVQGRVVRGGSFDLNNFPDMAPTLASLAFASGVEIEVRGAAHLELKESPRITMLQKAADSLGVSFVRRQDGFLIPASLPGEMRTNPLIDTFHDHRAAMAMGVLASVVPLRINDGQCVQKSFPGYWDAMRPFVSSAHR